MTPQLLQSYRFHVLHSACIVGEHAVSGLALARAELAARELDWSFSWEYDSDADLSWMSDAERKRDHEIEGCILRDAAGDVLASLWGITDADNTYRRTVEAELASEADAVAVLESLDAEVIPGITAEAYA
jgi:hypothetical protein